MRNFELPVLHHHEDGEHSHTHAHEHTHADGTTHSHSHDHSHSHGDMVGHEHSHSCDHDHDCGACGGCDPMAEAVALMDYMVKHNTAHAAELAQLGRKLGELGNAVAEKQVMEAVSEFEKANLRLSVVLASLK